MKSSKVQAIGLSLLISAFSLSTSASAATAPSFNKLESLGSSPGETENSTGLTASVHEAKRDKSGSFLSITWGIENNSGERVVLTWLSTTTYTYTGSSFSGVTVRSTETGIKHHPIMDSEGNCLCSGNTSSNLQTGIDHGDQISYWSTYSVPEDVDTVTVEIPGFEPIEDIPIS
ncbi:hypothetical protein ACOALZ_03945 [Nocardiopsis algeriensis]|uniref:hypothetical protein n=1 Tax=Nocardiopsis algeriensis TaxID=1478215 RepID=UPI003B439A42